MKKTSKKNENNELMRSLEKEESIDIGYRIQFADSTREAGVAILMKRAEKEGFSNPVSLLASLFRAKDQWPVGSTGKPRSLSTVKKDNTLKKQYASALSVLVSVDNALSYWKRGQKSKKKVKITKTNLEKIYSLLETLSSNELETISAYIMDKMS